MPLRRVEDYFIGNFDAMASPCEVLIDTDEMSEAESVFRIVKNEADRVESKFSRYREGNIVHQINNSQGRSIEVDEETGLLIDYAATCYEVSSGMFDLTSGALRRIWKFDESGRVPDEQQVRAVLSHIGWHRVNWKDRILKLPVGMEIDFGGIGKEYAVDRAAVLVAARTSAPFLINLGGDLFAGGMRRGSRTWRVGIDDPDRTGEAALYQLEVAKAGIATSGDARRHLMWKGKRLGHILNPKTGWPVECTARSITVVSHTCMEAGTLATLAYLQGQRAREFLQEQKVQFWIV